MSSVKLNNHTTILSVKFDNNSPTTTTQLTQLLTCCYMVIESTILSSGLVGPCGGTYIIAKMSEYSTSTQYCLLNRTTTWHEKVWRTADRRKCEQFNHNWQGLHDPGPKNRTKRKTMRCVTSRKVRSRYQVTTTPDYIYRTEWKWKDQQMWPVRKTDREIHELMERRSVSRNDILLDNEQLWTVHLKRLFQNIISSCS